MAYLHRSNSQIQPLRRGDCTHDFAFLFCAQVAVDDGFVEHGAAEGVFFVGGAEEGRGEVEHRVGEDEGREALGGLREGGLNG